MPSTTVSTPTTPTSSPATPGVSASPANKPITLTQTVLRPSTPGVVSPLTPTTPQTIRAGTNIVRVRTPGAGQIKVIGASGQTTQILRAGLPSTTTATSSGNMSGIAALAAAAAATQKITTSTGTTTTPTSVKVVQPSTLVTPQGIKVATTLAGQTVRLVSPAGQVINSQGTTVAGQGGKQFILQKSGVAGSQPQIVTLVKTSKGLTPMSKVNLVQSKPGVGGQGATIVKLVTTQAGAAGKPIMATSTTQSGQILSLQGGTPATVKTALQGQNIVIAKQQLGTAAVGGKQTIVITKPGAPGTAGIRPQTSQIIVVTTASAIRTLQTSTTTQAGGQTAQVSAGGGVKMVVVSSGGASSSTTTQSVTKPMTITVAGQAGQIGGANSKTVTIAAKCGGTASTTTLLNTGSGQIIAVPAQGLLQSGQQALTIGGKPVTVQVTTAGGQKTVTLVTSQASSNVITSGTSSANSTTISTVSVNQPSTSITGTGDGPVTSDAALAALAAEAGLIMPTGEGEQQGNEQASTAASSLTSQQEHMEAANGAAQSGRDRQQAMDATSSSDVSNNTGSNTKENLDLKKADTNNSATGESGESTVKQEPMDAETPGDVNNATQTTAEGGETSDPLATLASAAINSSMSTTTAIKTEDTTTTIANGIKQEPIEKKSETEWYDVGIIRGTVCTVQAYYLPNDADMHKNETYTDAEGEVTESKASGIEVKLQPGTAYKFRVAGINACGRGAWSEVSAFKTCLPGYPGAPSAIKISKSAEGAHLSWEPPQNAAGDIVEYSVYLAIRNAATQHQANKESGSGSAHLAFMRVYCGAINQCTVLNTQLAAAHIDTTNKPAIIFRIAARNDKGYGPATQVRWLQDSVTGTSAGAPKVVMKRPAADNRSPVTVKKFKADGEPAL
ncbi:Host cell factor 2 [Halocaridina rubra]|uniref:Host cell factor 2 n=1 Tax=Halocaridina rubra TaxID=373956 RepID=A0AAN8XFC7_HALRR